MNLMALMKALFLLAILAWQLPAQAEEGVIRLGMIGLDTSHVIAFTQIINNPKNNYGCKVVAGYSGFSYSYKNWEDYVDSWDSYSENLEKQYKKWQNSEEHEKLMKRLNKKLEEIGENYKESAEKWRIALKKYKAIKV